MDGLRGSWRGWRTSDGGEIAREVALLLVAVLIAAARLGGEDGPLFQAIAHIFIGGLGVCWVTGCRWCSFDAALFWLLCVVEVGAFVVSRFPLSMVVPLHQF